MLPAMASVDAVLRHERFKPGGVPANSIRVHWRSFAVDLSSYVETKLERFSKNLKSQFKGLKVQWLAMKDCEPSPVSRPT